jgi:hypothetical protein
MRSAAAALIVFTGEVFAHQGHGAVEGHFHGVGVEHVILFALVFLVLVFSIRK